MAKNKIENLQDYHNVPKIEDITFYVKDFEKSFEAGKRINKSTKEIMQSIKEVYDPEGQINKYNNKEEIMNPKKLYRFLSGKGPCTMRTLVIFAITFNVDLKNVEDLLRTWGLQFKPGNKVHHAYAYLIEHFGGQKIEICNKFLEEAGIDISDYL